MTQYVLYVGSGLGSSDIYMQSMGLGLSATVTNLPVDGSTLYVRLWWMVDSVWQFADYTYTAWTMPVMTSPVPASTLNSTAVNFQWSAGTGVSQYFLYVGSVVGASDIYMQSTGPARAATVTNLPVDGSVVYVRLWWFVNASWQFADYTYTALRPAFISAAVQSNRFGFALSAASNMVVVVEAATNVNQVSWVPLQTNTLTSSVSYLGDPQWTNFPVRFYRVRTL